MSKLSFHWIFSFSYSFFLCNLSISLELGILNIISAALSGFLVTFFFSFLLGAFYISNWIFPSIILGFSEVSLLAIGNLSYSSKFALYGFVTGSVIFPLNWRVCWTQSPIPHLISMSFGLLIGNIMNFFPIAKYLDLILKKINK